MSFSQVLAKIKENEEIRAKSTPIAMVAPELKQNTEDTEITKTCAVLGCEESKNLNSDSFFRFPEDPNFRQIWTDLTGRNNWTPTDYSYICVQHFSVDCFECDTHNSVVLNSKAVPSLKLPKHVLEVEYIDEETLDNEYEDDYDDEEDQDYEMEDEEHLHEEHLEEDHFSEEHNYIQQQQYQNQQDVSNNVQQNVSNIKHLTNGTLNRTTEKPSISHITDRKVNHTTEKPTISHITDKKVGYTPEKPTTSHITNKKVIHTTEKPTTTHITDKKVIHTTEKPTTSHITDKIVIHTIKKPTTSHITDKKVIHTTEKPTTSHITDKKVVHTTDKTSTSHITDMKDEESNKSKEQENLELLKVFTEVQVLQRQATSLKYKLRNGTRVYKRQSRTLARLKEEIEIKKNLLNQRRKKKSRILLSLQDKIREDTNGLVLAMPTRHTDDLKNFASSVYKYSPQAYIYIRNTLRTLLPSTDVLESWLLSGYEPKNVLTNSNMIRVVSELTDTELSCKVSLR